MAELRHVDKEMAFLFRCASETTRFLVAEVEDIGLGTSKSRVHGKRKVGKARKTAKYSKELKR